MTKVRSFDVTAVFPDNENSRLLVDDGVIQMMGREVKIHVAVEDTDENEDGETVDVIRVFGNFVEDGEGEGSE